MIVAGRRKERLDAFVKVHKNSSSIEFDIGDLERIPGIMTQITEQHADLDCIFINSGIQRSADFSQASTVGISLINQELTVNYLAPLAIVQSVLPFLQKKDSPTALMFTTSGLAFVPAVRCPNYCASKAALHHFALCLREQLKETRVKVIEIIPPAVQTELHNETNQPDLKEHSFGMPLEDFTDETMAGLEEGQVQIPVGMAKRAFSSWELERQKAFAAMIKMMGGEPSEALKAMISAP